MIKNDNKLYIKSCIILHHKFNSVGHLYSISSGKRIYNPIKMQ